MISIATYNEQENLAALVAEIHAAAPTADILITDDNSPDGTGRLADELAAADRRIHVCHRAGKLGLGTAILAALRYALDNRYEFLVNMDADFSHHPRYLPSLLAGMAKCDVMIGSRYVVGGGTENWPAGRRWMSLGVNSLTRFLMRIPAKDTSGGFRCYRMSKISVDVLDKVVSRGYSFQEELLYRCHLAGCLIGETPIIFENRRGGTSKANLREAVRSITILLRVGLAAFLGRDRKSS